MLYCLLLLCGVGLVVWGGVLVVIMVGFLLFILECVGGVLISFVLVVVCCCRVLLRPELEWWCLPLCVR